MRTAIASGLTLTLALLAPNLAWADDPPQATELLAGFEAHAGLFTVHRKGHKAYLEVPGGTLEQPFLLATSIAGGPQYTGFQWWTTVCAWQRLDDKLLLVEREVRYRVQDPRKPMNQVVQKTYTDRLIHAAPVVALNGSNPVVDLTALFGGQAQEFFGHMASGLDTSVVMVEKVKTFPENVELSLTLPDGNRDGRFTSLAYSIRKVNPPQMDSYRPRAADDRVGYFLTAVQDFTDESAPGDRFVRFANRWKLEPADPSLTRSPVKDPIIFYIEKSVPYRFRQAVRDGILAWDEAFAAVGLQNAIVVRQQTETEFTDLDPEDVRYNFFRWIASGRAFAMGPSRVNPWTGQILDADIVFDESMVRHYLREYDLVLREAPKTYFSPSIQRQLERNPARYRFAHATGQADAAQTQQPEGADFRTCSLGMGVAHQLALGHLATDLAVSSKGEYPEEFVAEIVKDVVMHEVGHTLGLRHNFKASAWRPMSEINGESAPNNPCASVMDYNPINVAPKGTKQGSYSMRTLGPYDLWAIEYGYGMFPSDEAGLKATIAAVASPQHAYGTDEDTTGPDPYCARWDLGSDPLAYAQQRMDMAQQLFSKALERTVDAGDSYRDGRRAVDMLLFDYQGAAMQAARFVGGQQVHRDHKGDPGEREALVPVSAELQRQALKLVCERVLSQGAIELDPKLLRQLGKGNWSHWGSRDSSLPHSYPYHERILGLQSWALFGLLNAETLGRLVDTEAKTPDAARLTIPEVLGQITRAVFGDSLLRGEAPRGTNQQPAVPTIQRNLQRHYVGELISLLLEPEEGPTPALIRDLARAEVTRLLTALRGVADGGDAYTSSHLQGLTAQMSKALEASFQIGGSGGGGTIILMMGEDGELRPIRPEDLPRRTIDGRSPDALPWNGR